MDTPLTRRTQVGRAWVAVITTGRTLRAIGLGFQRTLPSGWDTVTLVALGIKCRVTHHGLASSNTHAVHTIERT